jgi:hypothetical protein
MDNSKENIAQAHDHAYNAWTDFCALRDHVLPSHIIEHDLLHSISHHIRHAVWRTGQALPSKQRRYVRRHWET